MGKDSDTAKQKAGRHGTPSGASCGRLSSYPALQVLILNLARELLCREEWPKGLFRVRYAPGSLWTLPYVGAGRGGHFWQGRAIAGKMLLCQA